MFKYILCSLNIAHFNNLQENHHHCNQFNDFMFWKMNYGTFFLHACRLAWTTIYSCPLKGARNLKYTQLLDASLSNKIMHQTLYNINVRDLFILAPKSFCIMWLFTEEIENCFNLRQSTTTTITKIALIK